MSKKKKNDFSSLLLGVGVIIVIIISIVKAILPYILWGLLGLAIVFLIYYIYSTFKFYNRKDCLKRIGAQKFLNTYLTRKILSGKENVTVGKKDGDFETLRNLYKRGTKSEKIKYTEGQKIDSLSRKPFAKYHIKCECEPIVMRFVNGLNRGMVFYVFPETILVFAEGEERNAFVGAYDPDALRIFSFPSTYCFDVVVHEKSKNPIEYYNVYSPVSDAYIEHSDWTVKNIDGSRSFKGGLLPEHNPLKFRLRYARIKYVFGALVVSVEYSNYDAMNRFAKEYDNYFC